MSQAFSVARSRPTTLEAWLRWQEGLHPREIDLDLARPASVADALGLRPFPAPVVTIGGTNGKGSCAWILERLLGGATGTYTSPHLQRYNERIRIRGAVVSDDDLCAAFAAVEAARGATPLTYFEFGTLAALWLFARAGVDTAILEVGMGGRLDAVNILDADVAVITSIGLDHGAWLGHDRDSVGREKAGILRAGRPAILAEPDPPAGLLDAAAERDATVRRSGRDFAVEAGRLWHWRDWNGATRELPPLPHILPDNLAAALAAATALGRLAADPGALLAGLCVPGRRQVVPGPVELVLDVAHNAEAAAVLGRWLAARPLAGKTHLVLGMLADKPVAQVAAHLRPVADDWYAAGLPQTDRGLSGEALAALLPVPARAFPDPAAALAAARAAAAPGDRIVACGSFYTVGCLMPRQADTAAAPL